jgi:hypothetical protein
MERKFTTPTAYSSKLCKHGHVENVVNDEGIEEEKTLRFEKSRGNSCVQCFIMWSERYAAKAKTNPKAIERQREYQRKRRSADPEKFMTYQKEYQAMMRKEYPEVWQEYHRRREESKKRRAEGLPPIKYPRVKHNPNAVHYTKQNEDARVAARAELKKFAEMFGVDFKDYKVESIEVKRD